MSKNVRNLSFRKGLDDNLFENLAEARAGKSPDFQPEVIRSVADKYLIGNANVYGAATFYNFLESGKKQQKSVLLRRKRLYASRYATRTASDT